MKVSTRGEYGVRAMVALAKHYGQGPMSIAAVAKASSVPMPYLEQLIGPLRRFLRSCIGRPWNKIHSELSQKLDRRSLSGSHIWDHVRWEIETDCYIGADRLVYTTRFTYALSPVPVDGLYVHPKTGLIREQHLTRKRR